MKININFYNMSFNFRNLEDLKTFKPALEDFLNGPLSFNYIGER